MEDGGLEGNRALLLALFACGLAQLAKIFTHWYATPRWVGTRMAFRPRSERARPTSADAITFVRGMHVGSSGAALDGLQQHPPPQSKNRPLKGSEGVGQG